MADGVEGHEVKERVASELEGMSQREKKKVEKFKKSLKKIKKPKIAKKYVPKTEDWNSSLREMIKNTNQKFCGILT